MIAEAKTLLETSPKLPEGRSQAALEILSAAQTIADFLVTQEPAAILGKKGGKATARKMKAKDPDYYKRIAAMRKTRAGGRPKTIE